MQQESQKNTPPEMKSNSQDISVRYDKAAVTHTSQFMISPGTEDILLDFSSGLIRENDEQILPIHTRLAFSWSTAERLSKLLSQVVEQRQEKIRQLRSANGAPVSVGATPAAKGKQIGQTAAPQVQQATIPQATIPQLTSTSE